MLEDDRLWLKHMLYLIEEILESAPSSLVRMSHISRESNFLIGRREMRGSRPHPGDDRVTLGVSYWRQLRDGPF